MKKIAILAAAAIVAVSCSNGSKADEALTGEAQEVQAVAEEQRILLKKALT